MCVWWMQLCVWLCVLAECVVDGQLACVGVESAASLSLAHRQKHSPCCMLRVLFRTASSPGPCLVCSLHPLALPVSHHTTERTLPELKLALVTPRLITFNAYSAKQLGAILEGVLEQMPSK